MDEYISRQAAIDVLEKVAELFPWRVPGNRDTYDRYNEAWNDAIERAEIEIEELPSAQPEPRKGEWIDEGFYADGHGAHAFRCSECGGHIIEYDADPFCRWCGADMRGERNGRFNQQTGGD